MSALTLSTSVQHAAIPFTEESTVVAMASLKAIDEDALIAINTATASDIRAPVDVICVCDRSGSMAGEKLDLVRVALRFMLEQLKPTDRLGIVTYDDTVATPLPPGFVDAAFKTRALEIVDAITDGGSTNLSGGLFEGIRMIRGLPSTTSAVKDRVSSVFLFTDGLANAGLQTLDQIKPIMESSLEGKATVFTFALGSDHNEQMLKGIAETGKGMYYFFRKSEDVPVAFADCLGGLLSVVAQNIALDIKVADEDVRIIRAMTRFPVTTIVPEKHIQVAVRDIYADESRDILFEVRLPVRSCPVAQDPVLNITISFTDIVTKRLADASCVLRVDRGTVRDAPNVVVDEQRNRILAADVLEEANRLGQQGNLAEARKRLQDVREDIGKSASSASHAAVELQKQISAIEARMTSQEGYTRFASKAMAQASNEHYNQRCAMASAAPAPGEYEAEDVESVAMYSGSRAYTTKRKTAMRGQASAQTPTMLNNVRQNATPQSQQAYPSFQQQQYQQAPFGVANAMPPPAPSRSRKQATRFAVPPQQEQQEQQEQQQMPNNGSDDDDVDMA